MKTTNRIVIIAIALIWAFVIMAVAHALAGVPQSKQVLLYVGGGTAITIIIPGGTFINDRKRLNNSHLILIINLILIVCSSTCFSF
jgi:hypothetical protein